MNQGELNRLSKIILDASIEVFLSVIYKNEVLDTEFRIDILVENEIIIELKAVEILLNVHEAQILTYLKLADKRLGFLINFNVPRLIEGFKRKVNNF